MPQIIEKLYHSLKKKGYGAAEIYSFILYQDIFPSSYESTDGLRMTIHCLENNISIEIWEMPSTEPSDYAGLPNPF